MRGIIRAWQGVGPIGWLRPWIAPVLGIEDILSDIAHVTERVERVMKRVTSDPSINIM